LFVMWRLTGQQKYRDMGWEIWKAFERHTRVSTGGYTSLHTVLVPGLASATRLDKQESFFLAETLKCVLDACPSEPCELSWRWKPTQGKQILRAHMYPEQALEVLK
jgi:hypothetical protein